MVSRLYFQKTFSQDFPMKKHPEHTIRTFPSSRQFTFDVGKIGMRKHHIKALIEIDVTESRKKIKINRRESGARFSYTAWVLKCIARAVSEHKQVHALRKGKNKLIIFEDVDISLAMEKEVEGVSVPIPLVLRNTEKLSITEIYSRIEEAKKQLIAGEKDYVLEKGRKKEPLKLFSRLPQRFRLFLWKRLLSDPYRVKKMMGTVMVTSLANIGQVSGWVIPFSIHPLCFALGSVVKKPGVSGGNVAVREFQQMTVLIDHDVVDGAPAARFVSRLTELMEKGHGLGAPQR
jgi:pyruvate/2-oxoglutarate dehydrogenase complex dihydrolipoamide acyltransferase (E2) component